MASGDVSSTATIYENVCIWKDACNTEVDIKDGKFSTTCGAFKLMTTAIAAVSTAFVVM